MTTEKPNLISFESYSLRTGFVRLLNDITFSLVAGDAMAIVGRVGSGKSMLMRTISQAIWDPNDYSGSLSQEGKAEICGYDVSPKMPPNPIRAFISRQVVLVQALSHWLPISISKNFELVHRFLAISGTKFSFEAFIQDIPLAEWTKLQLLELSDLLPSQVSPPVLQQLSILRALSRKPKILILDEAFIGMDPVMVRQTENFILESSDQLTLLLATNDLHQASRISNKILFLDKGFVEEFNDTKRFFVSPKTRVSELFIAGREESF